MRVLSGIRTQDTSVRAVKTYAVHTAGMSGSQPSLIRYEAQSISRIIHNMWPKLFQLVEFRCLKIQLINWNIG